MIIITFRQSQKVYYENKFNAAKLEMLIKDDKNRKPKTIETANANSMKNFSRTNLNLLVIALWILFVGVGFYFSTAKVSGEESAASQNLGEAFVAIDESAAAPGEEFAIVEASAFPENARDFSRYSHTTGAHRSLSCLMCHRRDTNAARPNFPGHTPCAGCHAQEFAKPQGESQICTICHTGSSTSAMKRFGGLRSFTIKFSHAVHARARANCNSCHSPAQSGSRWIPAGMSAHNTCFQCHTSRSSVGGRDISSCATCHALGRFSRSPNPSNAYNVGFNHNTHNSMNCAQCHTISSGARGNQVSEPTAAMHFAPARAQSCASCHNNKRAFGGDDFRDCKRCHTGNRFNL